MKKKTSVIEFAEQRLAEEIRQNDLGADNMDDIRYWVAYLDGARGQKKEYEQTKIVVDLDGEVDD